MLKKPANQDNNYFFPTSHSESSESPQNTIRHQTTELQLSTTMYSSSEKTTSHSRITKPSGSTGKKNHITILTFISPQLHTTHSSKHPRARCPHRSRIRGCPRKATMPCITPPNKSQFARVKRHRLSLHHAAAGGRVPRLQQQQQISATVVCAALAEGEVHGHTSALLSCAALPSELLISAASLQRETAVCMFSRGDSAYGNLIVIARRLFGKAGEILKCERLM